jgi:hypothetical protein
MSIILNTNELLEVANKLAIWDGEVIEAHRKLALLIAESVGVTHHETSNQPGFGGLCSTFTPGPNGHTSKLLHEQDPGGEW